jgi:membrane protease YdiL (CAAX protease family)
MAMLGPHFDSYYLDQAGQAGMNVALVMLCAREFKIGKGELRSLLGDCRGTDLMVGISLGIVLLMLTFGESAIFTLSVAQFDLPLAYKFGNFHEQIFPSHSFFSTHIVVFVVASVLLPAIVEEFFFRALLFPALATTRTYFRSAMLCSALFTVLHFSKTIYLGTFVFSFVLCYLYVRERSLYACIAMHGCYNFLAFITQHYFDFHRTRSIHQLSSVWDWLPQMGMLVVSVTILTIVAYRYHRIFREQFKLATSLSPDCTPELRRL